MTILTVVLPVFNGMPHVQKCVDSILSQSYRDFRLLIIDDGSSDLTWPYLEKLKDPRVAILKQGNHGLGATLNKSIDLVETPFYARIDADDLMLPGRLEAQLRHLQANEDVVAVGGSVCYIFGNETLESRMLPESSSEIVGRLEFGNFAICHPATMFRTAALRKIGGYRVMGPGQDLDLFLRLAGVGKIENLPRYVHMMRISLESYSTKGSRARSLAYGYALENDRRRKLNRPEATFAEYEKINNSKLINSGRSWMFALSSVSFRRHLICRMEKRPARAKLFLLLSAASNPSYAFRKLLYGLSCRRNAFWMRSIKKKKNEP